MTIGYTLKLVDTNKDICEAFKRHFHDPLQVEIINSRFEEVEEFDCMVSAANSFGIMTGGVDLAIVEFFGKDLMYSVQQFILKAYMGEQPVGTSFIISTRHHKHKYIAHTPTMRIPMDISRTDNVYNAMRAMLLEVRQFNLRNNNPINTVLCPGLGTLTGKVPFDEAARQMACAYRTILFPPSELTWEVADERHQMATATLK